MPLRFLVFGSVLMLSSTALSQPAPLGRVSADFDAAFRGSDRDAALAIPIERLSPAQRCVAAMLRDQELREVHVPRVTRVSDFDRALLESARTGLLVRLPALTRDLERCLETLAAATEFVRDRERLGQRLEDLRSLARALEPTVSVASFPTMHLHVHEAEWDVSWGAIRERYEAPVALGEEGWRVTPLVANLVFVLAPTVFLPMSLLADDLQSPEARLFATGLALGSLGGSLVSQVWNDPAAPKTRGRLVLGALWTLASLAGGVALLASDVPQRFQWMGAGFVSGGVVDTFLWAGAVRLSRQARPNARPQVMVTQQGGALQWSARF